MTTLIGFQKDLYDNVNIQLSRSHTHLYNFTLTYLIWPYTFFSRSQVTRLQLSCEIFEVLLAQYVIFTCTFQKHT